MPTNQPGYGFDYDKLNRILGAQPYEKVTAFNQSPNFRMSVSGYDFNGNILGLTRKDAICGDMDNLQYAYDNSNQLQKVKDHLGIAPPLPPNLKKRFIQQALGQLLCRKLILIIMMSRTGI
ncbi:hypothetical protein GCM10011506_20920 [Marivirga lumbricoides]|uniref:Uncharacterized protein n=1 Tax=Marivirga lumbricoides TaxID=1046115 RepID=A0ABQ1M675_9BACT|nr:hypothetical protein GCM10011506_20920 [Marivirga lumbricoides]